MDAIDIFKPSIAKFYKDIQKYGEPSIYPRCDKCGLEYPHFYISDVDWNEIAQNGQGGWLCLECTEQLLGRKPAVKGFWSNLFESKLSEAFLVKAMTRYITREPTPASIFAFVKKLYPEHITRDTRARIEKEVKIK